MNVQNTVKNWIFLPNVSNIGVIVSPGEVYVIYVFSIWTFSFDSSVHVFDDQVVIVSDVLSAPITNMNSWWLFDKLVRVRR